MNKQDAPARIEAKSERAVRYRYTPIPSQASAVHPRTVRIASAKSWALPMADCGRNPQHGARDEQ